MATSGPRRTRPAAPPGAAGSSSNADGPPVAAMTEGVPALSDCAIPSLAEKVRDGDRRALARAITVVESTRGAHRGLAARLLEELLLATGRAVRIGVSGAPGVGKSETDV